MPRTALTLTVLLLLAGCSDSVTMVTADQLTKFVPGKTDETQIIASLGKPLHVVMEADGSKIDQYAFGNSGGSILPSWIGLDLTRPATAWSVSASIDRGR